MKNTINGIQAKVDNLTYSLTDVNTLLKIANEYVEHNKLRCTDDLCANNNEMGFCDLEAREIEISKRLPDQGKPVLPMCRSFKARW